jgi:hypothetical protein
LIVNWDNGTAGAGTPEFRVGNGAGADMFYVTNDGNSFNAGYSQATQFIDANNGACLVDPNGQSKTANFVANDFSVRDNGNGNAFLATYDDTTGLGLLPGYSPQRYPVLGSSSANLYLSIGGTYTGYWNTGGYTQVSDERMKTEVRDLGVEDYRNVLVQLDHIRSARFRYKQEVAQAEAGKIALNPAPHLGVIAQTLPPEVQSYDPNTKTYGMSVADMLGFQLAAIRGVRAEMKESLGQVDALRKELEARDQVIEQLKRRLDLVEKRLSFHE